MPEADLVLEGGGLKGLGAAGAVLELMDAGYTFPRVAGTSAGSIVGAFVAAGASTAQLEALLADLDYRKV
ncbi:MAG: patatin-like phospholipase family protein, partial [Mycobacteriaceae bacterium]